MSWVERRRDADVEWRMVRDAAETVACPRCGASGRHGAVPAQHCWNHLTGEELKAPAHDARVRAARSES